MRPACWLLKPHPHPAAQLAAKLLKAGPADNQSLYIIGLGFMYQGHNVSIEIAQNGLSLNRATSFRTYDLLLIKCTHTLFCTPN